MSAPTIREPIYKAIYDLAKAAVGPTSSSRIWKPITSVSAAEFPCLYQTQLGEDFKQNKGNPSIETGHVDLYLYASTESITDDNTVAPAIQLNGMMDALVYALRPDPATNTQTLGGLVSHAWISGRTQTDEGTLGQRAMLIVGVDFLITGDTPLQYMFDSGWLFMRDLNNANSTPVLIGALQSVQATVHFEVVEERGNFQHPIVTMRKAASIKGKASFAQIKGAVFSQLLFGQAPVTGSVVVKPSVNYTIPATAPYTITPTVPSGGAFDKDLGVTFDADAGAAALTYVSGTPAASQYARSGGVYTFNVADKGKVVSISITATSPSGNQMSLANSYSGISPVFEVYLSNSLGTKQATWKLFACESNELQFVTKLEDFALADFTFTAKANAANNIGNFSYSQ